MLTIMMNTNGSTPHLIEEAIQSILDQTYQDWILQITCIHPAGVRVSIDDPRIQIKNITPFEKYWQQVAYSLERVKTRYWLPIDSDDYVLPDHVEQLMRCVENAKADRPVRVIGNGIIKHNAGEQPYIHKIGVWTRSIYEGYNLRLLKRLWREKLRYQWGVDSVLRKSGCWESLKAYNSRPTYVYRYNVSYHVSDRNRRKPNHPTGDLPVIVPQYHSDLKGYYEEFLKKAWTNPVDHTVGPVLNAEDLR